MLRYQASPVEGAGVPLLTYIGARAQAALLLA